MILVDTSVWIDHLRQKNHPLREVLFDDQVLCHPFVIGELACGHLKNREQVIELMSSLPISEMATDQEVLGFVDMHKLYGKGIGWIDAHLLTAAKLSQSKLWTMDKSLKRLSQALDLFYQAGLSL
jgi:predicted nucleic acid-binding protein